MKSITNNDIASKLKPLTEKKNSGLSQEQIADKIGIAKSTLNHYLNGKNDMPAWVFFRLVDLLGVSAESLLRDLEVETARNKQEEATVPEVLDALATVLESFKMCTRLIEYEVEQTEFFPGRADIVYDDEGEAEYKESAFSEIKPTYYAIGIDSAAIQKLVADWNRKQDVVRAVHKDEEQLTQLLFFNEVEQAKRNFNAIDPICGALYNKDDEPIFIDNFQGSVPYALHGYTLKAFPDLFYRTEIYRYTDETGTERTREIPNRTRETALMRAGCTEMSFDQAITTGDLSVLEDELPF